MAFSDDWKYTHGVISLFTDAGQIDHKIDVHWFLPALYLVMRQQQSQISVFDETRTSELRIDSDGAFLAIHRKNAVYRTQLESVFEFYHILDQLAFEAAITEPTVDYVRTPDVMKRGWTKAMIEEFMPVPDGLIRTPPFVIQSYRKTRVILLETMVEVQEALEDARR